MRKTHITILLGIILLIILAGFTSCSRKKRGHSNLVITSIYPYELIVKQLLGSDFMVKTLIPANASPHTWSPNPSDLKDLDEAGLIISNGMGLETNLKKVFDMYQDKHVAIADNIDLETLLGKNLDKIRKETAEGVEHHAESEEHHHEAEKHDEDHGHELEPEHDHSIDPHIWTSPEFLILISTTLADELIKTYPKHRKTINANTEIVIRELTQLHQTIKSEVGNYTNPAILTFHNSFAYFISQYGIAYAGSIQTSPGKEPTLKELAEISNRIKQYKVTTIFTEPQMNKKPAEELAKKLELKILELDPLGTTLQVKTISEFIRKNWEVMKQSFLAKS